MGALGKIRNRSGLLLAVIVLQCWHFLEILCSLNVQVVQGLLCWRSFGENIHVQNFEKL